MQHPRYGGKRSPITADIVLINGRVYTMDDENPLAEVVAVGGGRIMAVGPEGSVVTWAGRRSEVVDCRGMTLLPGFHDAHCHLFATASALTGVDCRAPVVGSIVRLQQVVREETERREAETWIRGFGYDELDLLEQRHPTRWDLDAAAPDHPVRIDHRSGHAAVLNSRGLELAGILRDTVEPMGGVIERAEGSGEPTGVLYEMAGWLRERLGGSGRGDTAAVRAEGLSRLNRMLLECGITSVQDAGPGNDWPRWEVFSDLVESERLNSRVTMMVGASRLGEFAQRGMKWGYGNSKLRLGHAKVMLTMTTGDLQPGIPYLTEIVSLAHSDGFPVAIHAVEQEAIHAACRALRKARGRSPNFPAGSPMDRVEHCSEGTTEAIQGVKDAGVMVVTQPGFIHWNGERYRENVDPGLLPDLYPVGRLATAGVPLAFSSDSPVIDLDPWAGIAGAVSRRTREGRPLPEREGASQRIPVLDAISRYTWGGATSEGTGNAKGILKAGMAADMVLVDRDPAEAGPVDLLGIKTVLTMVGGRVLFENWA